MTRINLIPPEELTDKHLLAEYHELPRIFGLVQRMVGRGEWVDHDPHAPYILGKGHMRFFYTRLLWLSGRQGHLINELKRRGVKVQYDRPPILDWYSKIPANYWNWWNPTAADIAVSRQRINQRVAEIKEKERERSQARRKSNRRG